MYISASDLNIISAFIEALYSAMSYYKDLIFRINSII